jgi:hypothetical protein
MPVPLFRATTPQCSIYISRNAVMAGYPTSMGYRYGLNIRGRWGAGGERCKVGDTVLRFERKGACCSQGRGLARGHVPGANEGRRRVQEGAH